MVSTKEAEAEKAEEKEEKTEEPAKEESSGDSSGYELIYNDYAEQLRNRTQTLLEEYRSESAGQSVARIMFPY